MRTYILGCGPAGLLAAHAAARAGEYPVIVSTRRKSHIGGAQFLHRTIPGLTSKEPDGAVAFLYLGDHEGYAHKVYGDASVDTSWMSWHGMVPVWNMRAAYDRLWDMYEDQIVDQQVDPTMLEDIVGSMSQNNVFSAIPATALCTDPTHTFTSQDVWITEEKETLPNSILYNGCDEFLWYRASSIFGTSSVEYPAFVPDAVKVSKPLRTTCDCERGVQRVGRYGRWKKEVLIHHAFEEVEKFFAMH